MNADINETKPGPKTVDQMQKSYQLNKMTSI